MERVLWLCCTACMVLAVCCRHCCEHYHLMLVWLPTHCITIAAAADAGYRMCCGLNKGHFAAQACGTVCMLHGSMRDYLCLVTVRAHLIAGLLECCCVAACPGQHPQLQRGISYIMGSVIVVYFGQGAQICFRGCCVLWPKCTCMIVLPPCLLKCCHHACRCGCSQQHWPA